MARHAWRGHSHVHDFLGWNTPVFKVTATAIEVRPFPTVHPNGYNLSMCEFRNAQYFAYRYHPDEKSWRTQIAIVCDGKTYPLRIPEQYKLHSHEDPRYFVFAGNLYLSLTVARSRVNGQSIDPCLIAYGELARDGDAYYLHDFIEPKHPDNTWSKQSKNVVFRQSGQNLTMTWATYPSHVVHLLDAKGGLVTGWRTESPKCPFGSYRGGTQSFAFEGKRLRFAHAVSNNPKAGQYWGYNLMAYVFDSEPPFRIVKVSQQPILASNEAYAPGVPHWKPRICIPYGAVARGDGWLVSVGLNDCECAMAEVTRWDLNFNL